MAPKDEQRRDYIDLHKELALTNLHLAVAVEQMNNLNKLFLVHIVDDKATAAEVSDIKLYLATMKGKLIIVSSLGGCAFTWVGVLLGVFFKSKGVL